MLHRQRVWCVVPSDDLDQLAYDLTQRTWCGCTGFKLGSYLILNDSTSPDGAQEFAIVKPPSQTGQPYRQIETITFGWCKQPQGRRLLDEIVQGKYDDEDWQIDMPARFEERLQTPSEHGRCPLCA